MPRYGLIAGTITFEADLFPGAETRTLGTPFGPALVVMDETWAYVPRHGLDEDHYVLPHRINHSANLSALRSVGVSEVVCLGSTGALRPDRTPGTLVVPEDFISLFVSPTTVDDRPEHALPAFSDRVRRRLLDAAHAAGVEVIDGGVYFQTIGPRLETKAEIRLLAQFADLVGMTVGSEAAVAAELGLPLAALCSVDNFAHGVSDQDLSADIIRAEAKKAVERIRRILVALAQG
ncbi:MAG: MTAP family purine nucleoside phosphorylase [Proteobacteria bacterium]|nr:MTAP family purine nucleoside phosphorylase [Pseudomonadota bacterium]MBU1740199.1 MTAP family purine nucleoside phosphorylase [Pseudomonadota bacterium]